MSELGELIKTRREELGKTFRAIYQDTKIREQHLRIIERGAFDELPSYLHAYGFVKKYAENLGLDYANVVKPLFDFECPKIKKTTYQLNSPEVNETPIKLEDNINNTMYEPPLVHTFKPRKKINYLVVALLLIIATLVFFGYNFIFSTGDSITDRDLTRDVKPLNVTTLQDEVVKKEVAENTTISNNLIDNSSSIINPADNGRIDQNSGLSLIPENTLTTVTDERTEEVAKIEAAKKEEDRKAEIPIKDTTPKRLLLTFTEDCWIMYTADSYPPVEYFGLIGQSKTVMFVDNFTIDIGNAAGLSFSYGRQKFSNFGTQGAVLKGLKFRIVNGILTKEVK